VERPTIVRLQPHRVEALARAQITDLVIELERGRARGGGEVEQVDAAQGHSVGAAQLLHEVGLQALLEQRRPGAGADIAAERHAHARGQMPVEREQSAA
jgi:hypothetical protein